MRVLLASPALLAACLAAPPANIGGGDGGGAGDGDGGAADAGDLGDSDVNCPAAVALTLRSEDDISGWGVMYGDSCAHRISGEGLEFTNVGAPSNCSVYNRQLVDLTGKRLRVQLIDHDLNLDMSFTVVVGPPEVPYLDRRWLYFERNNGQLNFGECNPTIGCQDTYWGSADYLPATHRWLGFSHVADEELLMIETSEDGQFFSMHAGTAGVPAAHVACVGVDLGSWEEDTTRTTATSVFADLASEELTLR